MDKQRMQENSREDMRKKSGRNFLEGSQRGRQEESQGGIQEDFEGGTQEDSQNHAQENFQDYTQEESQNDIKENRQKEQTEGSKNRKAGQRKKNKEYQAARTTHKGSKRMIFPHTLQHISLVLAVVLVATVFLGSYVIVETKRGPKAYNLIGQEKGSFDESDVFNQLLGNSVTDIICYGAIRGQMETKAEFDGKKEVDVTAYAGRHGGLKPEYITARYYLEDLIKWWQAGFTYEEVYMSGEEADNFLSRTRTVTQVNMDGYSGGTISYLNSDVDSVTKVVDVSGNLLDAGIIERDGADATILGNRYRTVEGKNIEKYVSSWEEYYELCSNVKKAAEDLAVNYEEYLNYREIYDSDHSNVLYFIKRTVGNDTQVFTNMDTKSVNLSDLQQVLREQCNKFIYYNPKDMIFETNTLIEESTLRYILNGYQYAYPENTQIMVGVLDNYVAQDCFYQANKGFQNYVPYVWQYLACAVVCLLVYLFLLVVLTMKEGKGSRKNSGEISVRLYPEDRIPTEIMILAAGILAVGLFYVVTAAARLIWQHADESGMAVVAGAVALLVSLVFSFFYYSFVRRVKAKILWRRSLVRWLILMIKKWIFYAYDHANILLRVWVPVAALTVLNVGGAWLIGSRFHNAGKVLGTLMLFLVDGAVGFVLYRSAIAKQLILEGIKMISEGNLTHKVNEEGMYGEDLVLAQAVNNIGESVRNAVETSMKDERLKADLITNVSHDIKTPLTSIINYVDLIKRENVQDDKVRGYIEVLDSKSQRLKQLTDDLVEASKISSGNIVLQYEKINLVELLNQTIGEFSEKFEEKSLYPVFHSPGGFAYIEADSRRIWRVIENLFHNIFKYALTGTRVYIDLEFLDSGDEGRQVLLSIKNISAQPLRVKPEELTERFIRGDESRTTEGSGLGLSIAKNLTEVQNGKFEIVMDGDLFKVNLSFPLMNE